MRIQPEVFEIRSTPSFENAISVELAFSMTNGGGFVALADIASVAACTAAIATTSDQTKRGIQIRMSD